MRRFGGIGITVLAALAAASCKDVGLQGNIRLDQAAEAAPPPLVTQTTPVGPQIAAPGMPESVTLDSTAWAPVASDLKVSDSDVHAVGAVNGLTFYALRWDARPYDFLLAHRPDGGWQQYRRVN
jgi:hypothetical protein